MNASTKDENNGDTGKAIGNPTETEVRATDNLDLENEAKAVDVAISSSLFLASRQELLEKEAELKQEADEKAGK
jgi:hypothetical protein